MFDVITVGSATVDVFARTEFCEMIRDRKKEECIAYPVGSKILIKELILSSGGGGTNAAVALSRLGHKVAFLGKVGKFENSRRVMLDLQEEHVNTSLIVRKKNSRTGYSIILDSLKHDRTILVFRGSNNDLKLNEVKLSRLKTRWFYFSTMMGQSYETLEKLALYAEKNKIRIMFNISSYLAKKGVNYLKPILKRTDILVLNKEEAELLAGRGKIQDLLKKLHKAGPKIAAITDGEHGVYVSDHNYFYHANPHKVKVVETTGAGDAFASSFLSGMMKKNDIEFAIKLGMTNAESVIRYHGAKNKLLAYHEALRQMKKMPVKVIKERL